MNRNQRRKVPAMLALALLGAGPAFSAALRSPENIVWHSPSKDWHGSMPLGNGDIGVNLWVEEKGDLQFFIAKTDAWDDNARLVKVGKVRVHLEPNPFLEAGHFRQVLSLSDATVRIEAGTGHQKTRMRFWVDANHPVIHLTMDSDSPIEMTAAAELWRTNQYEVEPQASDVLLDRAAPRNHHAPTVVEPDMVLTGLSNSVAWGHFNQKSVGPELLASIQGLTGFHQADPLLHRAFGALITAPRAQRLDDTHLRVPTAKSHQLNVVVLTEHPSSPSQWLTDAQALWHRIEEQRASARRAAHETWWRDFWERSWIHARSPDPANDAGYVSQMFALQRFITACAGRGAYPIKFNGSLFTVPPKDAKGDADYRRWGPGYWWQNTRLPYESACADGDFDLMEPLFRMYAHDLVALNKYRTQLYCGHGGMFYPECIMFWGATFSVVYGWTPFEQRVDKLQEHRSHKWAWVGGLELCALLLDYYDYTGDENFLRYTALPVVRECLTFFDQHYSTNSQGQMVMAPSQAVETWWDCTNAMPELAGLHALTERVLELPASLAAPPDLELWKRLAAKLPPLPLREIDGRPALAPAQTFANKRNSENPELYAVFPFRLVALGRPHLEWGLNALAHRTDKGSFGWRQDDIFMAYLGLTDQARRFVVARARLHDPNERFPAFWGPNYDWTPDQDHGGVLMKAVQSMLLQSCGKKLLLLPAWPKDWDVEFKLHAPRNTVVECSYRNGKVEKLRVTPATQKADVVTPDGLWSERAK